MGSFFKLLLLIAVMALIGNAFHVSKIRCRQRSIEVTMSSTMSRPVETVGSSDNEYVVREPLYKTAPTTARSVIGRKMTNTNRRYMTEGLAFRAEYTKLRLLTREEEITAGKFSAVGSRLERIRTFVESRLLRRISDEEWAAACKLSVEQLHEYQQMAESARNRLVQHNIRLVDFWTLRLIEHSSSGKDVSYYELLIQGIVGLSRAAELYDGSTPFHKYAQTSILNSLYKGMTVLRTGSFLPHKTLMLNYRALRAQARLFQELQRSPTKEEIADTLGVHVDRLASAMKDVSEKNKIISASANLGGTSLSPEGGPNSYMDMFLQAGQGIGGEFNSELSAWRSNVEAAMDCLTPTEKRTLQLRYGLLAGDTVQSARSIEHTAELMCSSSEGVRKTIVRAMDKLRESPLAAVLEDGPPQAPVGTTNGRVGLTGY